MYIPIGYFYIIFNVLRKSLNILKRCILAIILLLLAVYIALHFPAVQTWVVKQVAASFSKKLHTRVTVKKVNVSFFNKLAIEGVLVEDRNKDTLLYAGTAKVNLTDWFFFKDKITLHYISLEDAVVNMNRTDSVWNYQFLVDHFSPAEKSKSSGNGIEFDLKKIELANIRFNSTDRWVGQNMIAAIKKASIDLEGIRYDQKKIIINAVYLANPVFQLTGYPGRKPPKTSLEALLDNTDKSREFVLNNTGWTAELDKLQLINGSFRHDQETTRLPFTDRFDGQHINFHSLSGTFNYVQLKQDTIWANISLSGKEKSGLEIKKLQTAFRVTPAIMEFSDLDLETNKSRIGNYFSMSYADFNKNMKNFLSDVKLDAKLSATTLSSDDLALFAPELSPWKRIFQIDGKAKGTIDNFSASRLKIRSGNSAIDGDITMKGLPDINNTFIDLHANNLQTNYKELVSIIPALKNIRQPQLGKLGNINYKGHFTGFLNDFVTYGTLTTNLGVIATDINMKLPQNEPPRYSGKIMTNGFRLGEFLNNDQLGSLSLNGKVAGSSFNLDKLNANFDGSISQIEFNGYNYRNLFINGNFSKNLFTGHLTMDDPNLKINKMDGSLSLSGKEIAFNLEADLGYANLKNIRFTKDSFEFSGLMSLNFTGNNIDNFLGTARIYNASLTHDSTKLSFDSLSLSSLIKDNKKLLQLTSNEIDAEIAGNFTILELPDAFRVFLSRYYPAYIKTPGYWVKNQDFTFSVQTKQVSEYLKLLDKRLGGLNNSSISGSLNLANYDLKVNATVPEFEYEKKKFFNIGLSGNGNRDTLVTNIDVSDIYVTDSLQFPSTKLQVVSNNDISNIHLKTSAGNTLNDAELNASIQTLSDGVKVHFSPSSFIINNKKWELDKDGELTVRKNFIDANEVRFRQDKQEIVLSTELDELTDETHIVAKMKNVNIGDFMPFVLRNPSLKGILTGTAMIRDPFGKFGIEFKGKADSFVLDDSYIGKVDMDASANTVNGEVTINNISADEGDYTFRIKGRYNYKDTLGNAMGIDLSSERLNLNILEPYLGSVFSSMKGFAKSNLKLYSEDGHQYLVGDATIDSGSVVVAYTQCKYLFNNETISFKKDEIDLGTIRLKDTLSNTGMVSGKMRHQFFKSFSFHSIRFETSKMLLLNTTKKDNSQFYGNVTGNAQMTLNGPITNLLMNINGQPSSFDSSHIYLPTGNVSKESHTVDYIEFIQFGSEVEDSGKVNQATNLLVTMNLTANRACKIDVILDEETGDIIKGSGQGNLRIVVGNKEPLSIRGNYEITDGEYIFNFQTFLKKPFTLNRGKISWNGDPALAIIDLEARYLAQDVDMSSLSPSSSLSTGSSSVRQRSDITILSHLSGSLSKPDISFEFLLPEQSDLKRNDFVVKRLEDYRNDANEMNKQVASLLLFNTFITGGQNFLSGENILSQATSTIGGMVSGWLTNMFNKELLKATNGILSTYVDINPTVNLQLSQLQATVRAGLKIFLSNRIYFLIGGNLDYNNPYTQLTRRGLITPDITIEWLLNKDGSLRVIGFNRTSIDITTGQRNRSGIQLSYRKDFNKLSDLFKSKARIEEEDAAKATKVRVQPK